MKRLWICCISGSLLLTLPLFSGIVTFQDGLNGYSGTADTKVGGGIFSDNNYGTDPTATVASNGSLRGLIRFDDIFGIGVNQIPLGATINSASLTISRSSGTRIPALQVHEMLVSWDEYTITGDVFGEILDANDIEAASSIVAYNSQISSAFVSWDITSSLRSWQAGATNNGWAIFPNSRNTWSFRTSEDTTVSIRPSLTVSFTTVPEPSTLLFSGVLFSAALILRRRR